MARRAFTLIEFLVVISIISLMIAILLPALSSARDAARSAACLSNLRQIAVVAANYSVDDPGGVELPCLWPSGSRGIWASLAVSGGYIDHNVRTDTNEDGAVNHLDQADRASILLCPSTPEWMMTNNGFRSAASGGLWYRASYGYNYNFGYLHSGLYVDLQYERWPIKASRIQRPSNVYRMMDGKYYFYLRPDDNTTITNFITGETGTTHDAQIDWRHGGQSSTNILYVDGHAGAGTRDTIPPRESAIPFQASDPWMARTRTDR